MLNSGVKKKYSYSRVVRLKFFERNKNHNPPCKLNGRSLRNNCSKLKEPVIGYLF